MAIPLSGGGSPAIRCSISAVTRKLNSSDPACGHGNIPGQLARRVVLVQDRHAWRHCLLSGIGLTGYWSMPVRARAVANEFIHLEHFPVALNQGDSQVLSLRRV